jgi:hypothetical protein
VGDRVQRGVRGRRYCRRRLLAVLTIAMVVSLGATVPALAEDGSVEPQVVGGTPVPDGKYPFMTSIQANTSKKPPYKEHFCGGTLIDQNSVLTAAHCVDFIGNHTHNYTLSYRDVRLVVGVTILSSSQGKVRRIDRLSDISIHPDYNGRTSNRYDAAVIEVGRPVRVIGPIALAGVGSDELETPGRRATVTGWGNTIAQPPFSPGVPRTTRRGCARRDRRSSRTPTASSPTDGISTPSSWSARGRRGWIPVRATAADPCSSKTPPGCGARSASRASVTGAGRPDFPESTPR